MDAQQPHLMGPSLDEAVAEARQIIADAKARYPHVATVALFSGGNDSTTMLHLCRDEIDFALHINTGIGVAQTREFVRDTAAAFDVRLVERITPPEEYRHRVVQHGFPGPVQHRTMYRMLKERRLREVQRELLGDAPRGQRLLLLSGVRTYESERRMGIGYDPVDRKGNLVWANPLFYWQDWTMYQYRSAHAVPRNPVSDRIHKSGECLCGAYAKKGELDDLDLWFPETADYIHQLEAAARTAGHASRARWGWGADRKRSDAGPSALPAAPGPMCSSCHRYEQSEMEMPA